MFFVAVTIALVVVGAALLVLAARYGRRWRTWLPLALLALLALLGAAWLLGVPALA